MKQLIFLIILVFSANSFASCHEDFTYNVNQNDLDVDVAYQDEITFAWQTNLKSNEFVSAEVINEANGFECDVISVEDKGNSCFHFTFNWAPGADLSWCKVLLQAGDSFKEARLFMSY